MANNTNPSHPSVYIVDGARTPFLKARGTPGPFSASDLAVAAGRALLTRQPFSPEELGEVILGCMMPSPDEANIGRVVGLRLGCGDSVPGWTVQRNCASGMQALDSAIKDIAIGRHDLVLAGGTEAMSRAPLIFNRHMVNWLAAWNQAKTGGQRSKLLLQVRPNFLVPIIALIRGLTDPIEGLNMGQTAEEIAFKFNIDREAMDEFALRSHQLLAAAVDNGLMQETITLYDQSGQYYTEDDGIRRDSTLEKLAKLKPFFDKKFGRVTAANSSQVSDGSALLILASAEAVKRHHLPVLGRIVDVEWGALSPRVMGLGPVFSSTPILQRHKLALSDIDFWEINEAFAAQVLGCIRAWNDKEFCQRHFGMDKAMGELDPSTLNVDGGAIAIGHPVGASGARIVLHLLHVLQRNNAKRGIAAICIGGGQGGSMLIERV